MNDNKSEATYHGWDREPRPVPEQLPIPPKNKRRWPWVAGGVLVGLFAIGQCTGPGVVENTNRVLEPTQPTEEPLAVEEKDETTEPTHPRVEDPPAPTDGLSDYDREYVTFVRENTTALGPWTDEALVEFAVQACEDREAGATDDMLHERLSNMHPTDVYLDLSLALGAGTAAYCPNYL